MWYNHRVIQDIPDKKKLPKLDLIKMLGDFNVKTDRPDKIEEGVNWLNILLNKIYNSGKMCCWEKQGQKNTVMTDALSTTS